MPSARQDDLELLRLAVGAHRVGALGENDLRHVAVLITDCFGDALQEIVERAWSKIEAVRKDPEGDDTLLACLIDVAYQTFWLGLTYAPCPPGRRVPALR
jgi:hypothetical protein